MTGRGDDGRASARSSRRTATSRRRGRILREQGIAAASKRAGPRDEGGRGAQPRVEGTPRRDRRGRLRDGAGVEERGVPRVRRARARRRRGGGPRRGRRRSRTSGSSSSRSSARTSRSAARPAWRRATARSSPTTSIRPAREDRRPRPRAGDARARADGRDAHRRGPARSTSRATRCRRGEIAARSARSTRSSPRWSRSPRTSGAKIVDGMIAKRFYAETRCSSTRRGSTTPRSPSARRSPSTAPRCVEFVRLAVAG